MTAANGAPRTVNSGKVSTRLALDDPAELAWGARLIQVALERRRQRLAASKGKGRKRDAA
ncbi:MAG: hypothetical protein ACTHPS_30370 [Streptosporangiaceae bacterium]